MVKLYMFARRCEEACERLQSEAHRYHSRIGSAQVQKEVANSLRSALISRIPPETSER